jgi:hypothetical protein
VGLLKFESLVQKSYGVRSSGQGLDITWMLLFVFVFCLSFTIIFPEDTDLSTTSYSLFKCSIIPLLIPNTPYSGSPKASYVEQAMTGLLLVRFSGFRMTANLRFVLRPFQIVLKFIS